MDNKEPTEEDNFEVGFRLLGNEIIGIHIKSKQKARNWIFFGILTMFAITLMIAELGPVLIALSASL